MANCGIQGIDDLNAGLASAAPIGPRSTDRDSVGVIQDFLVGQGHRNLPGILLPSYGNFGQLTRQAVVDFRSKHNLPPLETVDAPTLQKMVQVPAVNPLASRGYFTLVLDFPYDGMKKILSVVAQMEGAGRFAAMNLNTDQAGLSFGLIQWAQKPGRLTEILIAFRNKSAQDYARIFGDRDSQLADRLIAHTQKPNGGVDKNTGQTTDPAFDLSANHGPRDSRTPRCSYLFRPRRCRWCSASLIRTFPLCEASPGKSRRSVVSRLSLTSQTSVGWGARNRFLEPSRSQECPNTT